MKVITRHGGADHLVRPDRVYRTSVLAPTYNYEPGADVQAIATEFTDRPMSLQLGAAQGGGLIGWLKGQVAMLRMRRAAQRAGLVAVALPQPIVGPNNPIAIDLIGRAQALAAMTGTNNPGIVGNNQIAFRRATAEATVSNYNWSSMWDQLKGK